MMRKFLPLVAGLLVLGACQPKESTDSPESSSETHTGSVIFIHPDGSGASMWGALRLVTVGPDGMTNWDRMTHMGLYRSHQLNSTNSSSHAGATVHAYGVKVPYDTYGNPPSSPIKSASGQDYGIMVEAMKAGMPVGVINSGHICEPGTGVFLANSDSRKSTDLISEQIIRSGADLIFSGGERMLLPEGVQGRFGMGERKDGQNLVDTAIALGYTVIYDREELMALSPAETGKVLGVFAHDHSFHDAPEEVLREEGLPLYEPDAPALAEMTAFALDFLGAKGKDFLLVIEEEGSDNFANNNNAAGTIEALRRADEAIGVAQAWVDEHPNTLLVTGADSDAGGMQVVSLRDSSEFVMPLPATQENGAPIDGVDGTSTLPFKARPDAQGNELYFGISWASYEDMAGAVLVRTYGLNADKLPNNVDNSDIYRLMYLTLFGKEL